MLRSLYTKGAGLLFVGRKRSSWHPYSQHTSTKEELARAFQTPTHLGVYYCCCCVLGDVHVRDRTVVEKVTVIPAPAYEASSKITEAVIDSSIEPNLRPPITLVEYKQTAVPTPPWAESRGNRLQGP